MWFQGLVRKLKNSKKLPEARESLPAYLPPELVESILERITDYNTLLRCRLVCHQWKGIVNSFLEKRRLDDLATWNLNLDREAYFGNPSVEAVRPRTGRIYKLILPAALKKRNLKENPFPHKSLAILGSSSHCGYETRTFHRLEYVFMVDCIRFVQKLGKYLTSLIIHNINFKSRELILILDATPVLQTLFLASMNVYKRSKVVDGCNISPHLTNLLLKYVWRLSKNILPLFSNQLVSLNVVQSIEHLSLEKSNYANLRKVSLCRFSMDDFILFLKNTKCPPPLEYFSINVYPTRWIYRGRKVKDTEVIMNFIAKMSTSLTYLRLCVHVKTFLNFAKQSGVMFPNLRVFELIVVENTLAEMCWEEVVVKEMLSPAFPKLESVKFSKEHKNLYLEKFKPRRPTVANNRLVDHKRRINYCSSDEEYPYSSPSSLTSLDNE